MIIRYASHNLRFIYSTNTKDLKECPKVSTGESRRKRVPTPMHKFTSGTRKLITKTYIKWITWYPIVTHTSSVLKSLKTQSDKITSKGKLNSSQESRGGRNIIRSNYNSKARDTSRSCHRENTRERTRERERERERERDQTHSYWYIPLAPRVNYSLLVMESVGMMKMATGEGSPSGRVPEQGPDWFLVATEACGSGTPIYYVPQSF